MKKLYLFALFSTTLLTAQNESNLLFVNSESNAGYGGTVTATNIAKDSNGNTYLLGSFINLADFDPSVAENSLASINTEWGDIFIAKYDADGNYLWAKNIGGTGRITPAGLCIGGNSIFVTGNFTNTIDFDPSANVAELTTANTNSGTAFLAKYDSNGQYAASQKIDGEGMLTVENIKFLNNDVYLCGAVSGTMDLDPTPSEFQITSNGSNDAFVAKYNSSLLLQRGFNFGGIADDLATSLAFDTNGNVLISGSFSKTVDFDPSASATSLTSASTNASDTFIAKYSNNMDFLWVKDIGGKSLGGNSGARLALDTAGNIVITGSYNLTSDFDPSPAVVNLQVSGYEMFLAKYSSSGDYIFAKRIGGTGFDYSRQIALDASNNIFISGTFAGSADFDPSSLSFFLDSSNGTGFYAKYNNNGTFITAANVKANITAILINNTNELTVTGDFIGTADFDPSAATANLISLQNNNVFLAKYANDGSYVFAKPIGGDKPSNSVLNYIASDASGNIFRAGTLSAITDLDPSSAVFNLSSTSSMGAFIAKYNGNGGLQWAKAISGGTTFTVTAMNTDANGNTCIAGKFMGTVDFDPSENTANLTANGSLSDLYIAKYDSNGNYLWAKQFVGNVTANSNIEFDTVGNIYLSGRLSGSAVDFDPSPSATYYLLPAGQVDPYLLKLDSDGNLIKARSIRGSAPTNNWAEISKLVLKGNNVYIVGRFMGTVDFNPGAEINNLTTSAPISNETFFAKYSLDFDYQFAYNFNNNDDSIISKGSSIAIDNNDIYVTTCIIGTGNVDFDPSAANSNIITTPASQQAMIISKYNENGIFQWAKRLDGLSVNNMMDWILTPNFPVSFSLVKDDNIVIAFTTWSPINFDPTASNFTITPAMDNNVENNFLRRTMVFAKYNKMNGDFVWANKLGGEYSGQLHGVTKDNNENMLVSGMFYGSADFDFSQSVRNKVSASAFNSDRFWAKYDINSLGMTDNNTNPKDFVIYPNPTSDMLYINHDLYNEFNVTLLDITGKILQKSALNKLKGLDVTMYPKGMYFVQIESQNEKKCYKFIKE